MPLNYFAKHTHRELHVQTHQDWLTSKNSRELPDWPDVGEQDCLFGAVLRALEHCELHRPAAGEDPLDVPALRGAAVAGAEVIHGNTSNKFNLEFVPVLEDHVLPERQAHTAETGQVYETVFEYWKSQMQEGALICSYESWVGLPKYGLVCGGL